MAVGGYLIYLLMTKLSRKQRRQFTAESKYEFTENSTNTSLPTGLICQKSFSDDEAICQTWQRSAKEFSHYVKTLFSNI